MCVCVQSKYACVMYAYLYVRSDLHESINPYLSTVDLSINQSNFILTLKSINHTYAYSDTYTHPPHTHTHTHTHTHRRAGTLLVLEGQNLEGGTFCLRSSARERSDRAGGGCGRRYPTVGTFSKIRV